MTMMVIVIGIMLLIAFSVMIGTAMDTEAQRRQWKRVAAERQRFAEERRAAEEKRSSSGLCDECPYRNFRRREI